MPVTHFVIKVYGCFASSSLMTWVLRNPLSLIHLQPFQLHSARNRIKATSCRLLSSLCVLCELCVRSSSHKTVARKARKVRKERPHNKAPEISEPNRPRGMRLTQIVLQTNTNLRETRNFPLLAQLSRYSRCAGSTWIEPTLGAQAGSKESTV